MGVGCLRVSGTLTGGKRAMEVQLSSEEAGALCALLAQRTGDMVLRTDRAGFILAEPASAAGSGALIGPHIADLARDDHAPAVVSAHRTAIASGIAPQPIEFMARPAMLDGCWFELLLQPHSRGAIAFLREVSQRKSLEERLFAAQWADPLTGLSNRRAFMLMLRQLVDEGARGCLALFDIGHFQALNLRFGQTTGDEVLVVFADLLREMTARIDIVSRVGAGRFGVLMPGRTQGSAARVCQRIITLLADIARASPQDGVAITASAGLGTIGESPDATVSRAELALFMARASGGMRVVRDNHDFRLAIPLGHGEATPLGRVA